jgi:plastocyanin
VTVRKPLALTAALALLLATASIALGATKTIKIGDNYYVRSSGVPTVTVKKGTSVLWRNRGKAPHTVSVSRGPVKFTSRNLNPGKSYRKTVTRTGSYTIYCKIHGASDHKMKLRVVR